MVKLSDIQVYIIVIITSIDNLQGFGVGFFCFVLFLLCFCTKESNIFLPNRYIFNEKKRYINVCTFKGFFFNYFNPKHLPENNIPLYMLWNKMNCDELESWCFDLVT